MDTNQLPVSILIGDKKGSLVFADDHLKELNIDNLLNLTENIPLPQCNSKLYHTPHGLLIIYPFFIQHLSFQGYMGLLMSKDIHNEVMTQLIVSNQELEDIIEEVHDGIVVTDDSGRLIRINKGFEKISGIPRETMLNTTVHYGVDIGAYSASATLRVLETGKPVTFTNEYHYNNQIRVGIVTGRPLFDRSNNIVRVICNIRDITEINELRDELIENQLQATRYSKIVERFTKNQASTSSFVYKSKKMKKLVSSALKYAEVEAPVLITGESGSGKEMLTDFIHENSKRQNAPFLKINCGAIPEALLESELFGYEEGSFTGAKKGGHMGLFELAHHGTVLLDEIGELSMALQSKLLRFVEKMEFYRVGGNKLIKVDVRIIAATNRNLAEMIAAKQFRLDLFYRLNVLNLTIPPLRERQEDIQPLVRHFLQHYNLKYKTNKKISNSLFDLFASYQWPGNVRELENLVERLIVIADEECIFPQHLPDDVFVVMNHGMEKILDDNIIDIGSTSDPFATNQLDMVMQKFPTFHEARDFFEKVYLCKALEKYGSIRNTAAHIGLSHPAIIKKLSLYGIKAPTQKGSCPQSISPQ